MNVSPDIQIDEVGREQDGSSDLVLPHNAISENDRDFGA